jgi:hypothetical protein
LLQFESPAALFRVLTAKRWELIERLQTTGPTTLQGLARELDRDVSCRCRDYAQILLLCRKGCRWRGHRLLVGYRRKFENRTFAVDGSLVLEMIP